MAKKCEVLQTIAGINYGTAKRGDLMMFSNPDAEILAEKGMIRIISTERGDGSEPYIIGQKLSTNGPVVTRISMSLSSTTIVQGI